jgi:hypothetical protein
MPMFDGIAVADFTWAAGIIRLRKGGKVNAQLVNNVSDYWIDRRVVGLKRLGRCSDANRVDFVCGILGSVLDQFGDGPP